MQHMLLMISSEAPGDETAVEPARLDQPSGPPGPIGAFVRFQRPVAGGDRPQLCDIQIHRWPVHGR